VIPRFAADAAPADVVAALAAEGCAIVERLVGDDVVDAVAAEMAPWLEATPTGGDDFSGRNTRRCGALLARSPSSTAMIAHPLVLAVADAFLWARKTSFQLHLTQLIAIGPGSPAQSLHRDQWCFDFFPFPDDVEVELSSIWAMQDFTEANGATRVIPGSQYDPASATREVHRSVPAEMPKGSVVFFTEGLWHWQGERREAGERVTLHWHFNRGILRSLEPKTVDPQMRHRNSPRLGEILGEDDWFDKLDGIGRDHVRFAHMQRLHSFTNRQKARLKYVIDRMGRDAFVAEVEKEHGAKLRRAAGAQVTPRALADKHGHIGVHPQRQAGLNYLGLVLPVGRMTAEQMLGVADVAQRFGSGTIRLTVWQNQLISDVADRDVGVCIAALAALGLRVEASALRRGLVACTGNAGCKFAAANTKGHALKLADHLEMRLALDTPINIHLTGCHHSCAQHYIGDIGLIGARVETGTEGETVEGYHVHVGGGFGPDAAIAREIYRDVKAENAAPLVARMLRGFLAKREGEETFLAFSKRHDVEALRAFFDAETAE